MTATDEAPRVRLTQHQRREQTIGKILDATLACLAEDGYAQTTIARVAQRSGVSQGGLCRHFPTRMDLMVAAAERVLATDRTLFQSQSARADASVLELLELLRQVCRSPLNGAWYELLAAARTDTKLRSRLAPLGTRLSADLATLSLARPELQRLPEAMRQTLAFTIVYLFDGEALSTVVHPHPEQDTMRLELVAAFIESAATLASSHPTPSQAPA